MKLIKNKLAALSVKGGIQSHRNLNITRHILLSFLYKGGSIIANLMLVPLTISYLDQTNYGIWLTLTSFIAWLSFFDVGFGNGLRNKFVEAKADNDIQLARAYVSSAYFTIGALSLFLAIAFVLGNSYINWRVIFNTNLVAENDLKILMLVVILFFCIQLVAKLITTVYLADQQHSTQGKINFFTQIISLGIVWILVHFSETSLLSFGLWISLAPVFVLLVFSIFSFKTTYQHYRPSYSLWKLQHTKEIFGLGIKFFIIQITTIIIFTTDNFILTQLFGPAEVVPYNIAYKYFSISAMIFSIIVAPYWSSITDAFVKDDLLWIKSSMNRLLKLTVPFGILIGTMLLLSKTAYRYWVSEVEISFLLSASMALFFIISILLTPFTYFINGTGRITVQLMQGVIVAIVNVPLSFFMGSLIGPSGVILGTVICLLPSCVLMPLQYYKIINKNAQGIWNK